jgi:hypothetical protein
LFGIFWLSELNPPSQSQYITKLKLNLLFMRNFSLFGRNRLKFP